MSAHDPAAAIAGGNAALYLSVVEQEKQRRAQSQADALAYLTRRDLHDVAEILGLVESSPGPRRRRSSYEE